MSEKLRRVLDTVTDRVIAYQPAPKSHKAKKRRRKRNAKRHKKRKAKRGESCI